MAQELRIGPRIPQSGRAADAYRVAVTAGVLHHREDDQDFYPSAHQATLLHLISGQLHRIAERECNEDLTCKRCGGDGFTTRSTSDSRVQDHADCPRCAGTGSRLGKREARLRAQAQEIAGHYGLRCYFQTDPRGCSLYLIDPADLPQSWDGQRAYVYRDEANNLPPLAVLQSRWIEANYTRGHAVGRIGR